VVEGPTKQAIELVLQHYLNEVGVLVGAEVCERNLETSRFAQVLPSIPEDYRCCACAEVFTEHPGAAVQCPACASFYAQVEHH
jgi:hypothetical protein